MLRFEGARDALIMLRFEGDGLQAVRKSPESALAAEVPATPFVRSFLRHLASIRMTIAFYSGALQKQFF